MTATMLKIWLRRVDRKLLNNPFVQRQIADKWHCYEIHPLPPPKKSTVENDFFAAVTQVENVGASWSVTEPTIN